MKRFGGFFAARIVIIWSLDSKTRKKKQQCKAVLQVTAKISSSTDMDADFLKRTVGKPLSEALASLVIAQPQDPIEFIGEALLDYIKRRETETQVQVKY